MVTIGPLIELSRLDFSNPNWKEVEVIASKTISTLPFNLLLVIIILTLFLKNTLLKVL